MTFEEPLSAGGAGGKATAVFSNSGCEGKGTQKVLPPHGHFYLLPPQTPPPPPVPRAGWPCTETGKTPSATPAAPKLITIRHTGGSYSGDRRQSWQRTGWGGAELLSWEGASPAPHTRVDAARARRAGVPDPPLTRFQAPGVNISPHLSIDSVNQRSPATGVVDL